MHAYLLPPGMKKVSGDGDPSRISNLTLDPGACHLRAHIHQRLEERSTSPNEKNQLIPCG
jgi:hypothetical protein